MTDLAPTEPALASEPAWPDSTAIDVPSASTDEKSPGVQTNELSVSASAEEPADVVAAAVDGSETDCRPPERPAADDADDLDTDDDDADDHVADDHSDAAELLSAVGERSDRDRAAEATDEPSGPPDSESSGDARIELLAAMVANTHLRRESWDLALRAERRNDPDACLKDCLDVLALAPDHREARLLGARSATELRNWTAAAQLLAPLLRGDEPAGALDWDRIVAATLANDPDGVDASVDRLGLDAAAWADPDAIVLVVIDGTSLVARRVGAALAEVQTIAAPGRPQHVGDLVVFDPRALAVTAAATGELCWPTFPVLDILLPGNRQVWTAHGSDPGFEAWEDAVAELAEREWVLRRLTPYQTEHSGDPAASNDVLGAAALPDRVDAAEVQKVLVAATRTWPSPVAWFG